MIRVLVVLRVRVMIIVRVIRIIVVVVVVVVVVLTGAIATITAELPLGHELIAMVAQPQMFWRRGRQSQIACLGQLNIGGHNPDP